MKKTKPIIIEQEINAPLKETWHALTDLYELRNWYFYLDEFKPDIGYSFHFISGNGKTEYVHLCIIINVIKQKLLSHTWKYKGFAGDSEVSFEIASHQGKTIVKLTHSGTENFINAGENFTRESFENGWKKIICENLKNYLEKK